MTILIIGGTGQTGSRLASLLDASYHHFFLTSRSGDLPAPYTKRGVRFDWDDESTFENPFKTAAKAEEVIERVYLVIGSIMEPLPIVRKFLDLAKEKGVKRFVLLSSSASTFGENPHGVVHEYITSMPGIEYAVLRPTWFIDNFSTIYRSSIKDNNYVFSVTEDGRVPLIAADDIAQAAFDALISEKSWNEDKYIVGPDLVTFDEAAELLSKVLGRTIVHKRLTADELRAVWLSFGLPQDLTDWLVRIEGAAATGTEEKIPEDKKYVGKVSLEEYLRTNQASWRN